MGNETESTVVKLGADVTELKANLAQAQIALVSTAAKMEQRLDQFSKNSDKNLGFLRLSWVNMVGSFASDTLQRALGAAASAVGTFVAEGIKGAAEDEVAFNRLNRALEASGLVSQATKNDMEAFAGSLEATTTASDDAIASAASLIQTMGQLDKEGLKRATKAALDLSAAYNIDLDTAARNVGKAAEGNVTAFGKMGLAVQKGKTDAETFANTLDTIEARLGGSAERATKTYTGATTQLGIAWGNTSEALAKAITQNPALIALVVSASKELRTLAGYIDRNRDAIKDWVNRGIIFSVEALSLAIKGADLFGRSVQFTTGILTGNLPLIVKAFQAQGEGQKELIAGLDRMKTAAQSAAKANKEVMGPPAPDQKDSPITHKTKELKHLKTAAEQAGEALMKTLNSEDNRYQRKLASNGGEFKPDEETPEQFADRLTARNAIEEEHVVNQFMLLAEARKLHRDNDLAAEAEYTTAKEALLEQYTQKGIDNEAKMAKAQAEFSKRRADNMKSTLGTISTLQASSNKELFAIGKAAAMATATIDGFAAVQKALASAPPPYNFILAGLVGAATAVNLANIASTSPPAYARGIDSVPGFGHRDTQISALTPGERVTPVRTNKDLTAFLARENARESSNQNVYITVNVAGNILDRRETGVAIIQTINEAARGTGAKIFRQAIAS